MNQNYAHFKKLLETELDKVEKELASLGRKNPSNPQDWEAIDKEGDFDSKPDRNELADALENFEEKAAILNKIEAREDEIKKALKRIDEGTYGKCRVDGKDIEHARLEANPAAETCIEHLK